MSSPGFAHKGLADEDVLRVRVKGEIRKRLRGLRKTTPAAACAERSTRIVANLEGLEAVRGAVRVALFWPIEERHEVDLRPLDALLRARGAAVYYPTIKDDGEMVFAQVRDPSDMQEHALGFLAPLVPSETNPGPDVIVVPAIAIDPTGHRIGYGAGYYDRALRQLMSAQIGESPALAPPTKSPASAPPTKSPASAPPTKSPASAPPTTIGVAFDFQLIPEVPATANDVAVEWVVTDRRVLCASREASEGSLGCGPLAT
jgi:5-formyltetrahydrofolate cyclo-ligase